MLFRFSNNKATILTPYISSAPLMMSCGIYLHHLCFAYLVTLYLLLFLGRQLPTSGTLVVTPGRSNVYHDALLH